MRGPSCCPNAHCRDSRSCSADRFGGDKNSQSSCFGRSVAQRCVCATRSGGPDLGATGAIEEIAEGPPAGRVHRTVSDNAASYQCARVPGFVIVESVYAGYQQQAFCASFDDEPVPWRQSLRAHLNACSAKITYVDKNLQRVAHPRVAPQKVPIRSFFLK